LVLVLCFGNICRSPFAAARSATLLAPLGVRVESAGLYGPGRPTPRAGIEAARARGVDLSGHTSQLVTAQLVRNADLIVVMDSLQAQAVADRFDGQPEKVVLLGDLDPLPIRTRRIHDPEAQSGAVFSEVYARIERCVATLATALGAGPPHA
jgi:protein-tyrosine-phosphatase